MMNEMILDEADLVESTHWPVTVIFGLFDDGEPNCPSIVCGASGGTGYSFNDKGLVFWDELDECERAGERPFDVECFLMGDSCKLTHGEFFHYMNLACERYAKRFPERKQELADCLKAYSTRFLANGETIAGEAGF